LGAVAAIGWQVTRHADRPENDHERQQQAAHREAPGEGLDGVAVGLKERFDPESGRAVGLRHVLDTFTSVSS
jgi:hypothetical protein